MNVKFIPTKDHLYVEIYVDSQHYETRSVQIEDGKECIYVPNLLRQDGDVIVKSSFAHRIGDMVEHIRRGWGDAIMTVHRIVHTQFVVWFLDREYGKEMRKKSLAGWRGAKFAWAVFERNNIFGDEPLNIYGHTRPLFAKSFEGSADNFEIQYYDTEAEAQKFIDDSVQVVKPLMEKLYEIPDDTDHAEEINTYYDQHIKPLSGIQETIALCSTRKDPANHARFYVGQILRDANIQYSVCKIFVAHMNGGDEFYVCRGDALDRADDDFGENMIHDIMRGADVTEASLKYPTNQDLFAPAVDNGQISIYRIVTDDYSTDWYWRMEDCFNDPKYAEIKKYATEHNHKFMLQTETLNAQKLQPTIPTEENPYVMTFAKGDRGLIARANLRPDEVGDIVGKKKVYFPDKSCADNLCAGKVRVTNVNDLGNYGFVKGTMITYSQPTEEELASWLVDHMLRNMGTNATLHFVTNPKWGGAIKVVYQSKVRSDTYIAKDECGVLADQSDLGLYDHSEDQVSESIDLKDYICTGYTGHTYHELCGIVTHISGLWKYDLPESCTFISEDFDEAIEINLIDFRRFNSFNVCIIHEDRMCLATSRLQNDLMEVLETAKRINDEAVPKIAALKKKGKIQ